MKKERIWTAKTRLGLGLGYPAVNFNNWGILLANLRDASKEEIAVASTGLIIEAFGGGFRFEMPSDEEALAYDGNGLQLHFKAWNGERAVWDGVSNSAEPVVVRFVKELLGS